MGLVQLLSALYFLPLLSYFTFFCDFASLQLPHCYTRQAQRSIMLSSTVHQECLKQAHLSFSFKVLCFPRLQTTASVSHNGKLTCLNVQRESSVEPRNLSLVLLITSKGLKMD